MSLRPCESFPQLNRSLRPAPEPLSPDPPCYLAATGRGRDAQPTAPLRIGGHVGERIEDVHKIGRWLIDRKAHQAHLTCAASPPPFSPWASDAPDEVYRQTFWISRTRAYVGGLCGSPGFRTQDDSRRSLPAVLTLMFHTFRQSERLTLS
jgi:hypothetical protein